MTATVQRLDNARHKTWDQLTTVFAGSVLFLHAYATPPVGVTMLAIGVRNLSPSTGQLAQPFAPHRLLGQPSQRTQRAAEGTSGFLARKWPALLQWQGPGQDLKAHPSWGALWACRDSGRRRCKKATYQAVQPAAGVQLPSQETEGSPAQLG